MEPDLELQSAIDHLLAVLGRRPPVEDQLKKRPATQARGDQRRPRR